jgi:ABC-type lipoprotein release transport system permease subunit
LRLSLFFAFRYLFGRKSHNAINFISGISLAGITVGTMALIIVLSVFNGFEDLVKKLYNTFDPDIKITAARGKVFSPDSLPAGNIGKMEGVAGISRVVEDKALFRYRDKQHIGILKGVDPDYPRYSQLGEMMLDGDFFLGDTANPFAIAGSGVAWYLSMGLDDIFYSLEVYVPSRTYQPGNLLAGEAFRSLRIRPAGIFSVQQDFDTRYVLAPISFARVLWDYQNEVTAIEVHLKAGADAGKVSGKISRLLGSGYKVQDRYQQQESLYKIMKTEKYAIFLILSFIILVATFNVVGSLSMVVVEKQKDIAILRGMGAGRSVVRNIFISQGMAISLGGGMLGMLLGFIACFLQQQYGWVRIYTSGNSFVVDQYPVLMQAGDFAMVAGIVMLTGFIAAWIPASRSAGKDISGQIRAE